MKNIIPLPWFGVSRKKRTDGSFQCCIKDEDRAPQIRLAEGLLKPLHGAVIKSHGIERWRKGIIKVSGKCIRSGMKVNLR